MIQIGCETCLKFQKSYSSALRQYSDAMQRQVDFISKGDFGGARGTHAAVNQAGELCAERRHILEHHEATEHKKQVVGVR
jgi:hypothetical protein